MYDNTLFRVLYSNDIIIIIIIIIIIMNCLLGDLTVAELSSIDLAEPSTG